MRKIIITLAAAVPQKGYMCPPIRDASSQGVTLTAALTVRKIIKKSFSFIIHRQVQKLYEHCRLDILVSA